jgi:hypothetical protein
MSEVKNLKILVESCYSEYLLGKEKEGVVRREPDAGLGMNFKYPGDARKLRDRSKMRLWAEYLRGIHAKPLVCYVDSDGPCRRG